MVKRQRQSYRCPICGKRWLLYTNTEVNRWTDRYDIHHRETRKMYWCPDCNVKFALLSNGNLGDKV